MKTFLTALFQKPVIALIVLSGGIVGALLFIIYLIGGDQYLSHKAAVIAGIASGSLFLLYSYLKSQK